MKNINNLDDLFSYTSSMYDLKAICDYICKTFVKPDYSSIPKEYYPFLYKLLSYRKYDYRGKYKPGDIRTFFVGQTYGNNSIMFFDKNGRCDCIGVVNAIKEWQNQKNDIWNYEREKVLYVLRNLIKPKIQEIRNNITLPVKDEITGEMIYNMKDIHIDHYDSDFSRVAYDWMYLMKNLYWQKYKRTLDIIHCLFLLHDDDFIQFTDDKWNNSFLKYHDSHTHLRITTKQNNLKREKHNPNWEILTTRGYYIEKYEKESNK